MIADKELKRGDLFFTTARLMGLITKGSIVCYLYQSEHQNYNKIFWFIYPFENQTFWLTASELDSYLVE